MVDKDLEGKINNLREKYTPFSREDELIVRISQHIHEAMRSLIPNGELRLAQDEVENYEERGKRKFPVDNNLVEGLWEIVNYAWDKYGEEEKVRN